MHHQEGLGPFASQTFSMRWIVTNRFAWLWILLLWVCLATVVTDTQAARVEIGPQGDFTSVEAAINDQTWSAGDTLEIAPGTFTVASMLKVRGSGSAGAPIVVRGAGMGNTVIDGSALTGSKALWDLELSNRWWVFEDMTVSGMRGSQTNARGFFLVGCEDITLQRVEVTDCWNGIMSASGAKRVTLQYSNIHHCGGLEGPAHNIYMNSGEDFLIQHNWLHDAQYGMCYKDRTSNLRFQYNWVENADIEGYEVSLAGGSADQGETLFLGNIFVKSPTSAQQTHFVRFENGRSGTFKLVHNTFIAQPTNVVISSIASTTTLENNILVGGASLWSSGSWAAGQNWIDSGLLVPAELAGGLRGTAPGFASNKDADYTLASGSPCIDAGAGASVTPVYQWNGFGTPMARTVVGPAADLGAFEAQSATQVSPIGWGEFKLNYR